MSQTRSARVLHLVQQARSNPELAQRVAQRLPEQLRLAFIAELAQPLIAEPKDVRPGPRKCSPSTAQNGLTAQLNLFARSVARVS